jgi:hypothetical protein
MQIFKTCTLLSILLLLSGPTFAQSKSEKGKDMTHELGLNVTSLLADLLGNNNRTDAGRYLLTYKKVADMKAFRMGLAMNFNLNKQNSNFNTTLVNQNFQVRLGKEWRHEISAKLHYYFGFDGIGGYTTEESAATTIGGNIIQKDKTLSFGAGPVLGFQFALYDKLLIGTEGSLYATFNKKDVTFSTQSFGGPPPTTIPSRNSTGVAVQTNLPTSLFLILKF